MDEQGLIATANALVTDGQGILAADESTGTATKRLASVNVDSTEATRQAFRNMLFTTEGIEQFLSGVILYEETLFQNADDGTPFPQLLASRGIIPGIKVDKGAKPLAGSADEKVTEGLDGLRERLATYREHGARFAKWRAVIDIADGLPSDYAISANVHALARYAALCQEAGLVPIVEPEVMMDGVHSIERCEQVSGRVLDALFAELEHQRVRCEGLLLKPNMVLAGKGCSEQADVEQVAEATLRCFRRFVPAAVPGIVFLSGGQDAERATAHLNAMNRRGPHPWKISFSFSRALQAPALETWRGERANVSAAQRALYKRARNNAAAVRGEYDTGMEDAA
jgi:fructose-bisphosphate aldolase class I